MIHSARNCAVGLALVAVVTAACTDPASTPGPTTSIPTVSVPTTTERPTTPADPRLASAEETVTRFSNLLDLLGADPMRSLDELTTVSRGQTLETWRDMLTNQRRRGQKQIGTVAITLSGAKPTSDGKVTVDACLDVSKTDLVDKAGKSVVSKNRAPRVRYTYIVEQGTDGRFYVVQDKAVGTC